MDDKMKKKQKESKSELEAMLSDIKVLKDKIASTDDPDVIHGLSLELKQKSEEANSKKMWIDSRAALFKV